MPYPPWVVGGKVYEHSTTTAVESVNVSVRNTRTNEYRDGADDDFSELTTNSAGEFQCNLANFTGGYQSGDEIEVSINHDGLKDMITFEVTSEGAITNLVLTPLPEEVYDFERALDEVGSKVAIYSETRTFDSDYESIDTETRYMSDIGGDCYASIQIESDEESQEEEGIMPHGLATGYFKKRYNIDKDSIIIAPTGSSNYWRVMDKPILHTFNNEYHHYEAKLMRIPSVSISADGGSLVSDVTQIPTLNTWSGTGSDCNGNDGATSRVLTFTTSAKGFSERIYLEGRRLKSDDYSITFNNTSIEITFSGVDVWNDNEIVVDYQTY